MVKKFLKVAGWILAILLVINIDIFVFNHVSAWAGVLCWAGTIIGIICLALYWFGKLSDALDREEERLH